MNGKTSRERRAPEKTWSIHTSRSNVIGRQTQQFSSGETGRIGKGQGNKLDVCHL